MKQIIGVTGPTGAGKGIVSEFLGKLSDADVIDADKEVRKLYSGGRLPLLIADAFGKECLAEDGSVDRKKLGAVVFSDSKQLQKLNDMVLPVVADHLQDLISKSGGIVILDAPTLIESGLDKICTRTLAVLAPKELRIERIMQRDNISRDAAMQRVNAQHKDEFYIDSCDDVVCNQDDLSAIQKKLEALFPKGDKI